jgi:hypothetical protein
MRLFHGVLTARVCQHGPVFHDLAHLKILILSTNLADILSEALRPAEGRETALLHRRTSDTE